MLGRLRREVDLNVAQALAIGQLGKGHHVGGTRQKLSMIPTVTHQSKTRWMTIDDALDADKLIEFLQALIKDTGRKVVFDSGQFAVTPQQNSESLGG